MITSGKVNRYYKKTQPRKSSEDKAEQKKGNFKKKTLTKITLFWGQNPYNRCARTVDTYVNMKYQIKFERYVMPF